MHLTERELFIIHEAIRLVGDGTNTPAMGSRKEYQDIDIGIESAIEQMRNGN